jgi:1-acyl-sn-glycerol-3-phosphate acyltransferase
MTKHSNQKLTFSIFVRSLLFNSLFYFTVLFTVLFILAPLSLLKSAKPMRNAILKTINFLVWLYDKVAGVKIIERGIENIPRDKGFIYCSKHMSNMDALLLYRQSPNLTALAKKELLKVPLLNLVFKKMGVLGINRGASEAQKQTPEIAKILLDKKIPMIIFAEGTRTVVGERRPLKSGAFYYQQEANLDIIVVAHNAGVSWPKKSIIKWPGTLILEYSPAIPKKMDKNTFMAEIERRLLDRSEELML